MLTEIFESNRGLETLPLSCAVEDEFLGASISFTHYHPQWNDDAVNNDDNDDNMLCKVSCPVGHIVRAPITM